MTAEPCGFVVSSLLELTRVRESEGIELPIVLSPEDNPVEESTFECVFDERYLENAFYRMSRLSETRRVLARRLTVVE